MGERQPIENDKNDGENPSEHERDAETAAVVRRQREFRRSVGRKIGSRTQRHRHVGVEGEKRPDDSGRPRRVAVDSGNSAGNIFQVLYADDHAEGIEKRIVRRVFTNGVRRRVRRGTVMVEKRALAVLRIR